jgi:hypothetical protein
MARYRGNIPRSLADVLLPKDQSLEAMLGAIERELKTSAKATLTWRKAQRARQDSIGIRGGGAAATIAQAQAVLATAKAATSRLAYGGLTIDEARKVSASITAEYARLNELVPEAVVVILFRSGGPFIYPNSAPSDYYRLQQAGSKGKEVHKMGWGPDGHPTYRQYSPDPARVIDTMPVASTWLLQIWLTLP